MVKKSAKKVITVFGTRPEAIKLAPVVKELEKNSEFVSKVIVTGQHRQMLDQVLQIFDIKPHYDLDIMTPGQTLSQITGRILEKIESILIEEKPDLVLVQGDTATAFVTALAAFYQKIPVGHVEAGLRTYNKYDPFPEEMNRQLLDIIADYYFAPTERNKNNLLKEGKDPKRIFVTGNTVIDALLEVAKRDLPFKDKSLEKVDFKNRRVILVTTHRRENLGQFMEQIHKAIRRVVSDHENTEVVFPVHLNPVVQQTAQEILGDHPRVHLVAPLDYEDLVKVMKNSYLVMTDSGGIQEEAPSLDKPVLVLRRETERQEGVEAGALLLVGVDEEDIFKAARKLLTNKSHYQKVSSAKNPYGDGKAGRRIVVYIKDEVLS